MSTHFRSIWVFHQSDDRDLRETPKLIASRRFMTVETRLRSLHERNGIGHTAVPNDDVVKSEFCSCILKDKTCEPLKLDGLASSFHTEIHGRLFETVLESDGIVVETEWPHGPTMTVGGCWPFIFVSVEGKPNERFWICGLVAVFRAIEKLPLVELPEVTAAFGVLDDLKTYLPSCSVPRFMFLLKTALPFGSPVCTNIDILAALESTSLTANDALSNAVNPPHRIPAWKPFPSVASSGSPQLKLHLVESVSFEILDGDIRACSISGKLFCFADMPGTPEIVVPVHVALPHQILTLHDCAKFSSSSNQDEVTTISFIPPTETFTLCSFVMADPLKAAPFPLDVAFKLLQVSPTQFKFCLSTKLRFLFAQFSIIFCVNKNVPISNLAHLTISPRCKAEIYNETFVLWTFRHPSTYSDGETLSGVIETQRPLMLGEEISRSAVASFRIANAHFSNIKILKESISFFPTVQKASTNIIYETVSTGGCHILNSGLDNGPPTSSPIDLNDCVDLLVSA